MKHKADIGVFGGSGFYSFLENVKEITIETPYGAPSDKVALAEIGGKMVAFLPRHNRDHTLPPHKINFKANLWAMKELGIKHIIGPCAAGSLQAHVEPGHFVVCDQFVNRTWGRPDTFYDGPITTHVSPAEPYCPLLRKTAIEAAKDSSITVHEKGTVVVIQGPRFSTRAESREFSRNGWEVINMTQYPEAMLARELEICYVNISLITDYDAGLEGHPDIEPVTHEGVLKVFKENNEKLKRVLFKLIEKIDVNSHRDCVCSKALGGIREI